MARRPPPQVLRHLLEGSPIQGLLTAPHALLQRADLKLTRLDELTDVQRAIRERFACRLSAEGASIALAAPLVLGLLFLVGIFGRPVEGGRIFALL